MKAVAEDITVRYPGSLIKTDSEIAESIVGSLKWHSALNEEKIKIKVEDGVVTLDGEVNWEFQRNSAVTQIQNTIGVKRIINNITIKSSIVPKELKLKVSNAFHRSATLDAEKIEIDVQGSKVILKGKVRSWAEKNDAENAVWAAPGVNKVENNLEIDMEVFAY